METLRTDAGAALIVSGRRADILVFCQHSAYGAGVHAGIVC